LVEEKNGANGSCARGKKKDLSLARWEEKKGDAVTRCKKSGGPSPLLQENPEFPGKGKEKKKKHRPSEA